MHIASPLFVSLRRLSSSASTLRWLSFVPFVPFVSFVAFVSFVHALPAEAQPADAVGVRAQGMGGAFTAVADDATAAWWNPAGLAGGSYFRVSSNTAISPIRPIRRPRRSSSPFLPWV